MTEIEVTQEMQKIINELKSSDEQQQQLTQSVQHGRKINDALRTIKYRPFGIQRKVGSAATITVQKPQETVVAAPVEDKLSFFDAMKLRKALRGRRESDPILKLKGSEVAKIVKSECRRAYDEGNFTKAGWIQDTYNLENFGFKDKSEAREHGRAVYLHALENIYKNPLAAPLVSDFLENAGVHPIHHV